MLTLIRVRNYTIVDELELELEAGFSVLTGETGAGKSILVDALGLALGDRAEAGVVRQGAERAEVSVVFECPPGHPALRWLEERALDDGRSCALRRLIGADGRSRAFINSQPARLQDLRDVGELLIDIHGQHEHQSLRRADAQRLILDRPHEPLAARVAAAFSAWREAERQLASSQAGGEERAAQLELLRFQAEELERLAPEPGEPARLAAERGRLANVDRIAAGVGAALSLVYEAEAGSAHEQLGQARQELARLIEHDADLGPALESLEAAEIHLREAASVLARHRDRLEPDPTRLEWIEARLARMRALARRHQVDEEALPDILPQLEARIRELDGGEDASRGLTERAARAAADYFAAAEALSAARAKSAAALAAQVTAQLTELGLPHGRFRVALEPRARERAEATGLERIEFQVQLNPGLPFGPLGRVASGGELSRISLALEVVAAGASRVPTLVFDEVDAGIGGGVAEIVGGRLSAIARDRQVLCVTHLPQVASQGRHHYRVAKLTDGKTSRTRVQALSSEERVEELSRMLGGIEITERARAHAAEMIERAR